MQPHLSHAGDSAGDAHEGDPASRELSGDPATLLAAIAQLVEGVIVTDAAGRITFVNAAAARLHGVARLDVPPQEYAERYHLLTLDGAPYPSESLPLARAVLRGETVVDESWRIRRPDGSEILAVGSARPLLDAEGRQMGAVLTLRDESAREAAAAAERQRDVLAEQLRHAFEQSPVGTVIYDASGRPLTVNRAFERLWGVGMADLPADYNVLADPQLEAAGLTPGLRRVFGLDGTRGPDGSGEAVDFPPLRYDVANTTGRGHVRWTQAHAYPVRDAAGAVERVVLTHEDITARIAAEESVRQAARALAERNEQLQETALELELSNQSLQDQAVELETQTMELQDSAWRLEERTTAAIEAQHAADVQRARVEAILEGMDESYFVLDAEYRFVAVNSAMERSGRLPRERLLGRSIWEAYPGMLGTEFERVYRDVAEHRVAAHFSQQYTDEEFDRSVEVNVYPTGASGIAVFWRDISERVRAQAERERLLEEIAMERSRLAEILFQAPVAVAVVRGTMAAELVFELANPRYVGILPRGRAVQGRPLREVLPEFDAERLAILQRVLDTGEPYVATNSPSPLDRDGDGVPNKYYFDFVYHPLTEAGGAVVGIIAVGTEVTESVRARQEADRLRAIAEEANRAKSEFLSTMSHELRTPLNAIGGYSELLGMGLRGPVTDAQVTDLQRISRASQHLQSLINDILNFTRVDSGRVDFDLRDVPMDELLTGVEELVMPQLRARGLDYHRAPEPGANAAVAVRTDPEKFRQIVVNLVSNAIKFTPAGAGSVTLAYDAEPASHGVPRRVRLLVTDTGRGIPSNQLERIFEPFVQLDRHRSETSQQGVGLGLSISRNLARALGGDIAVKSREGEGSTFTVLLPAVDDTA